LGYKRLTRKEMHGKTAEWTVWIRPGLARGLYRQQTKR
jgi:hypothetical protein